MNKVLLLLIVVFSSISALESEEDPCKATGGGATAGLLCVEQQQKIANKKLDRAYLDALHRIKREEIRRREIWPKTELVKGFLKSQNAWIKYRDAKCTFYGISATPSPWQGVQIEECKLKMINERIKYLNNI